MDETLVTEGCWSIVRTHEAPYSGMSKERTRSYIKHKCSGEDIVGSIYIWPERGKQNRVTCWRCGDLIPNGIKGTWIMHNWEELQNGK